MSRHTLRVLLKFLCGVGGGVLSLESPWDGGMSCERWVGGDDCGLGSDAGRRSNGF